MELRVGRRNPWLLCMNNMQISFLWLTVLIDKYCLAFEYFGYAVNEDVNVTGMPYVHLNTKLEEHLFKNYSSSVRPVKNFDTVTKVFFYPMITHVEIFNEKQETIAISGSLYLVRVKGHTIASGCIIRPCCENSWYQNLQCENFTEWVDEHLTWNKEEFNGLNRISVMAASVWRPNLMVYNSVGNISQPAFSMFSKVFVNANGRVVWYPFFRFEASCNMDFSTFPYDSHVCPVIVGPWSYLHTEIEFELFHESPEIFLAFNESKSVLGGWTLESSDTRLGYWNALSRKMSFTKPKEFKLQDLGQWDQSNISEIVIQHYFPFVEISPKMKRFSNYFGVLIKMPMMVSSLINICNFLIMDFRLKMTILIGNLMLQFCFMDDLMNILPYTSDSIPGIAKFFASNFILTISAVTICIISYSIRNFQKSTTATKQQPIFLQRLQNALPVKFLVAGFLENQQKIDDDERKTSEDEKISTRVGNSWAELSITVQAVSLICYCILYVILFAVFL